MSDNHALMRQTIAAAAKEFGMTFKYPDRLTRAEAQQVLAAAKKHPEYRAIMLDKHHANHKAAVQLEQWGYHFAHDHPADAAGEPLGLEHALPAEAPPQDGRVDEEFAPLLEKATPQQAQDLLNRMSRDPELAARLRDPNHPEHQVIAVQWRQLHEKVYPGRGADTFKASLAQLGAHADTAGIADRILAEGTTMTSTSDTRERVEALHADKDFMAAYRNKSHPGHADAVAKMAAAYEGRADGSAPGPRTGGGAPLPVGSEQAQQQIRGKQGDTKFMESYRNRLDPGHAAAVQEMGQLYSQAYPEPAAAAGAQGGTNG